MSARVSHHPLVVNTADGACWTRRAVTSDGRGLYALAGAAAGVPDEVLTSLAELAELGITGSAFALPMPVGAEPRDVEEELIGANLSLYEEELDNARLRLALKSAQRGRRELRARVAALLDERHSTNDALADITVAERSAAKLGALLAPDACPRNVIDGDAGGHFFRKGAFADSPVACSYCGAKRPESGGAQ